MKATERGGGGGGGGKDRKEGRTRDGGDTGEVDGDTGMSTNTDE